MSVSFLHLLLSCHAFFRSLDPSSSLGHVSCVELMQAKEVFVQKLKTLKVQLHQQVDQKFDNIIKDTIDHVNVSPHQHSYIH
jgi:hypothetical protein